MAITRLRELASSSLHDPHGVDFLTRRRWSSAIAKGGVVVFRLPAASDGSSSSGPTRSARPRGGRGRPGSVRVDGRRAALVCNNWANTITRQTAEAGGGPDAGEAVLRKRLDLPDGRGGQQRRRWLVDQEIITRTSSLSIRTRRRSRRRARRRPARGPLSARGVLRSRRPVSARRRRGPAAGARLQTEQRRLAGRRLSGRGDPRDGRRDLARGHVNPQEGGPKGIDLYPQANVLAVTAESEASRILRPRTRRSSRQGLPKTYPGIRAFPAGRGRGGEGRSCREPCSPRREQARERAARRGGWW